MLDVQTSKKSKHTFAALGYIWTTQKMYWLALEANLCWEREKDRNRDKERERQREGETERDREKSLGYPSHFLLYPV